MLKNILTKNSQRKKKLSETESTSKLGKINYRLRKIKLEEWEKELKEWKKEK
jgi:hypothetical protein